MNYIEYFDYINKILGQKSRNGFGLISVCGSFGEIDSNVNYEKKEMESATLYTAVSNGIELRSEFINVNNVCVRKDFIKNVSNNDVYIYNLVSRFLLSGGEYSVYTQYNSWQTESAGGWQDLVTCVKAESFGIRSCDGAAPIMALKNKGNNKTIVFNLIPNCRWQIEAKVLPSPDKLKMTVVETGFNNESLNFLVKNGEEISLPEIVFYEAESDISLDGYKFQQYLDLINQKKGLPIMYNSWLYCFDNLDVDKILEQIDIASDLGIEIFTIDAGWFGAPYDWVDKVGDWEEDSNSSTKGRLKEISDKLKDKGMTFGLWFEPERVGLKSKSINEHSKYYFDDCFTDFANNEARDYLTNKICSIIDKYNVGFLKFDFNATTPYSKENDAFYQYYKGQKQFIDTIRNKYPNIYIENCASGGYRMSANNIKGYDSFWISDNQSPIYGVDIVKNTIKRLNSKYIDRWVAMSFSNSIPSYGQGVTDTPIYCNDALWLSLCRVDNSYLFAFLTGGGVGFSCDLSVFPKRFVMELKEFIAKYKARRDYYLSALSTVIYDSKNFTGIEYFDTNFNEIEIMVFAEKVDSPIVQIYPLVDKIATYMVFNQERTGKDISENGIIVDGFVKENMAIIMKLNKKQ